MAEVDTLEEQQPLDQTAQLRAVLDQTHLDAWAGLRTLPPRLMLCDAEDRMPKHERWFRVRAEPPTRAASGASRPTLSWGQKEDGAEQMQWKSCSSRPPKRRSIIRVSADDYPAFALGFLIDTDKGPVRVNAPDAESKRRWLTQVPTRNLFIAYFWLILCAHLTHNNLANVANALASQFEELNEASKLCGLSDAELTPLATTHGCFTMHDVSAALLVGLGAPAPAPAPAE